MWWEIRKLAVVVVAIDVLVALAALLVCVAIGAVSAVAVGTAIFAGAFVLAFAAIGAGNGVVPGLTPARAGGWARITPSCRLRCTKWKRVPARETCETGSSSYGA